MPGIESDFYCLTISDTKQKKPLTRQIKQWSITIVKKTANSEEQINLLIMSCWEKQVIFWFVRSCFLYECCQPCHQSPNIATGRYYKFNLWHDEDHIILTNIKRNDDE